MTDREIDEMIIEALLILMKDKNINDITVCEIAKKAGVARGTYYRHFRTKEDIIKKFFDFQAEDFKEKLNFNPKEKADFYEISFMVFSLFKDKKEAAKVLIKSNLEGLYLSMLTESITKIASNYFDKEDTKSKYLPIFIAGALYNTCLKWLASDCKEPVKEIADVFFSCIPFGE